MTHRSHPRTARRSSGRRRDDEGSVLLVVLLIMFLSITILTVVQGAIATGQIGRVVTERNTAIQGALAGNQAALGDIRAAATAGYVDPTQLPCSTITGTANTSTTNTDSSPSWSANVQYYEENAAGTYTAIGCTQGSGPTGIGSNQYLARAVITSCSPANTCPTGSTPATTPAYRRVVSTYTFKTTDVNIPGGPVYTYSDAECLVAVANGGGGYTLDVTNGCNDGNSQWPLEQFQYTSDWQLEIVIGNEDLCVQDPEDLSSPPSNPTMAFVSCTNAAVDQWGIDDNAGIEGVSTSTNPAGNPNGWCLENPLGGASIPAGTVETEAATIVSPCDGNGFSSVYSWQMSATAGAGGAAPPMSYSSSGVATVLSPFGPTNQLVNYQEFGRCMDVTGQNVNTTYLIDYDCKQFPDTSAYPIWNQRWCFYQLDTDSNGNAQGVMYTPDGSTSCNGPSSGGYCLESPGTNNGAVVVTPCPSTLSATSTPSLMWSSWANAGGSLHDYTWTDSGGLCLEANPDDQVAPSSGTTWSEIQVATCSGAYDQKWNAPPSTGSSQLANTHEGTGSGAVTGP